MEISNVLVRPLITEKTTLLTQQNVYVFHVNPNANKIQVTEAIEKLYKVKVNKIRVTTRKGKIKRVGRRMTSKQMPDVKIAYIYLKEGTIDLFPKA